MFVFTPDNNILEFPTTCNRYYSRTTYIFTTFNILLITQQECAYNPDCLTSPSMLISTRPRQDQDINIPKMIYVTVVGLYIQVIGPMT